MIDSKPQTGRRRVALVAGALLVLSSAVLALLASLGADTAELVLEARRAADEGRYEDARILLDKIDDHTLPDVVSLLARLDAAAFDSHRAGREEAALAVARRAAERGEIERAAHALGESGARGGDLREEIAAALAERSRAAARIWDLAEARRLLEASRILLREPGAFREEEADLADRESRDERARTLLEAAEAARERGDYIAAERALIQARAIEASAESRERAESLLLTVSGLARRAESREEAMAKVTGLLDEGKVAEARRALEKYVDSSGDEGFTGRLGALKRLEEDGAEDAFLPARRALRWIAAHQSEDGGFHNAAYGEVCGEKECGKRYARSYDAGVTGLALMAFTAFRELDVLEEFAGRADRAAAYLAKIVKPDGTVPGNHYNHAIVALALAEREILAEESTEERSAAERVASYLTEKARLPDGGWRYGPKGESDVSVTCWVMQALDAAERAGIEVPPEAIQDGLAYLGRMTGTNGATGYLGRPANRPNMTAAALLVRLIFKTEEKELNERSRASLLKRLWIPARGSTPKRLALDRWKDGYGWYYATYAFHRMGGEAFKDWARVVQKALMDSQVTEGHLAGTFEEKGWDSRGGRIYATALNALTLAVTYRRARVEDDND